MAVKLRAIGSVAITHPKIAIAHAVRLEDELLPVGGKTGPPNNPDARQEPHGRNQRMPLVLEVEPPDCVPSLPHPISELVPSA
jgi:hypothetical protein